MLYVKPKTKSNVKTGKYIKIQTKKTKGNQKKGINKHQNQPSIEYHKLKMLQDVMEERKENEEAYHQKKLDDKKFRQDQKKLKNMINQNDDEVLDPENINYDALLDVMRKNPTEVLEVLGSKKLELIRRKLFEKQKKIEKQNEKDLQDQVGAYIEDVEKSRYEPQIPPPPKYSKPIDVLPPDYQPEEIPSHVLQQEGQLVVDSEKEEEELERAIEMDKAKKRRNDILSMEKALAAESGKKLFDETHSKLTDIARRFNDVRIQKNKPHEYRTRFNIMMDDPVLRNWIIETFCRSTKWFHSRAGSESPSVDR
ncbi:hypothetical protein PAPYR_12170 [Paratrimastix pyriformis]|uniref:Uncharacterized protein n=1 Tax=Paratrimastix pyriformis TaxID=342808 RepID=A0ABQ8U6X9_9EUKA|nr:hypothetical protein PAPYR_12170 [Paratrimastix pyriformis]